MITKSYGKVVIHLTSLHNQLKVSAANLKIIINDGSDYLRVIRPHVKNEQRVSVGVDYFQVRYGSQRAGFDAKDQLVLI